MDFCIPDIDLSINSLNNDTVEESNDEREIIHLTFVDSELFKLYMSSNEYNDPSLRLGGKLYNLMIDEDINKCSEKKF